MGTPTYDGSSGCYYLFFQLLKTLNLHVSVLLHLVLLKFAGVAQLITIVSLTMDSVEVVDAKRLCHTKRAHKRGHINCSFLDVTQLSDWLPSAMCSKPRGTPKLSVRKTIKLCSNEFESVLHYNFRD